jgi:hypothetical protein
MDDLSTPPARGASSTTFWSATCKDCAAEESKRSGTKAINSQTSFEYSDDWATRTLARGGSRSDRCERHRRAHRLAIQALSVPYVDLDVIGEVADPLDPGGPLGGLGPLPITHSRRESTVDLARVEFGMTDADVIRILDGLQAKQVAVVEAGTGTGKSTFMPFRLMQPPAGHQGLSAAGPIVVTEPRRAAATGVARFVGEELCLGHDSRRCDRHIGPGYPVGYQVSDDKRWDAGCQLIYVTDGTIINWIRDGQLARIGTVIIDEAHERSENIDVILALLREKVLQYNHLRVIVASATLDRDFFVEYFGGPDRVFHMSIPPTKAFGYGIPLFIGAPFDDPRILAEGTSLDGIASAGSIRFEGWAEFGPSTGSEVPERLRDSTRHLAASLRGGNGSGNMA